tara:strand:+ start:96 stop:920 length:825 start_codon:yes stop_codon:yes gene_type:complete
MKHNKKRNTAFLYESLIKELTVAIVRKDNQRKEIILNLVKENFTKGTPLHEDLKVYKSILENKDKMTKEFSSRFLLETKKDFYNLNRTDVFNRQTSLIDNINKQLSNSVYRNFVPNYKNIATVGQWLNSDNLDAKTRLIIEGKVVQILRPKNELPNEMKHIDNLTYNTFVEKFNETYDKSLRENQKSLLTNYITSFSDNGLGLKAFMNEEVGKLKNELKNIISSKESNGDTAHLDDTQKVLVKLEEFKSKPINEEMVRKLFYIQDLVEEISNGH